MAKRKKIIITNSKEIYDKFNMLHFSNEVLVRNVKSIQLEKIINNVNKGDRLLSSEKIGDCFLIKKLGHVNFNIYLK